MNDEDDEVFNPLVRGAAAPPGVIGGGCLARFDPEQINEDSGTDFASLAINAVDNQTE